jgi:uncharacterized protein (DUF2141 family)
MQATRLFTTLAVASLAALAAAVPPLAQAADAAAPTPEGCIAVEVSNVRAQQGFLMVAAYAGADSFGKKPVTSLRLAAGEATMRFQLCGLQGHKEVALMLFQDLDSDGKMGRNIVGLPTEPWGGSGAPGAMGPTWDASKVPLDGRVVGVRMSI